MALYLNHSANDSDKNGTIFLALFHLAYVLTGIETYLFCHFTVSLKKS